MPLGPLLFEPYLRPQVWGGRRLGELFGKRLPSEGTFGESWEISAHSHHVSRVSEGRKKGILLTDLAKECSAELFGQHRPEGNRFGLLIKLLDCSELLSIQVHPNDELAARILDGERGKTEAWVVLDVGAHGRIHAGLKEGVTRADLQKHLEAGTTDQCLHSFRPKIGDCLFIRAGTVHAVGGGVVIAEVQQSSDATFRLFDWNRLGSDGKPRQLHIEQSLEAIDFEAGPLEPVTPSPIPGLAETDHGEILVRCEYFGMDRYLLSSSLSIANDGQMSLWMMLDGSADLQGPGYHRSLGRGETVMVPADCEPLEWVPTPGACLLRITCEAVCSMQ